LNAKDHEISQEVRLVALRQLVAYAIAAAHRDSPQAKATFDEVGKMMIRECVELATAQAAGRTATRNTVIAHFSEEVSGVMSLAGSMVDSMRSTD
jgi:hypothetical protein